MWQMLNCGLIAALLLTGAGGQDRYIIDRAKTTLQRLNENARASALGLERYAFVNRLANKFDMPFYSSPETSCTALFPAGRADRVYMLLWNAYWPSGEARNWLLCYERARGGDTLVYRMSLPAIRSVKLATPNTSLQGIISQEVGKIGWCGAVSAAVRQDLALKRDYVQYKALIPLDELDVIWLSKVKAGQPPDEFQEEQYDLGVDPLTNAKLKQGEFYKKYGLPVSSSELKTLKPRLSPEIVGRPPDPSARNHLTH